MKIYIPLLVLTIVEGLLAMLDNTIDSGVCNIK